MQRRTTKYSGLVALASLASIVACQDGSVTGLRPGAAGYAKGPGGGGTTTPVTTTGIITGGTGMTAAAGTEVRIDGSPCDVIILAPGNLPLAGQTPVYASPGQTVKLYADAAAATGGDFTCHVVMDATAPTGISAGEGLIVQAPDITVDLNGTSLHSDADVFTLSGNLAENHGIIVKENKVTLTNSSTQISKIDFFTVGASIAQISNAKLVGRQLTAPATDASGAITAAGVYNIQFGRTYFGAALKLDRVIGGSVSSVSAVNVDPNNIESRGADAVRSQNLIISDVDVEGVASGIRFRDTQDGRIEKSFACGPVMGPVEFARNVTNVTAVGVGTCAQ
jgi:hypothetical protein